MRKMFLLSAILGFVAVSCAKEEESTIINVDEKPIALPAVEPSFNNDHDELLNALTKSMSAAVRNNVGMRTLIKEESLLCFDGDVDFLISAAVDKPVQVSDESITTKSESNESTFGELIQMYCPNTKGGEDLIDLIQQRYPDLQVAVPIHAEEWNPEEYTPVVAFLPEEYDDMVTKTIPGYDSDGNYVEVDAINEPDKPIIVISHNERMGDCEEGRQPRLRSITPTAPTNLTAKTTANAILLTWNYSGTCSGFSIWRQGSTSNNAFCEVGRVLYPGKSYYDTEICVNTSYQYYVLAYNDGDPESVSGPSNQVEAISPSFLSPLTSFTTGYTGNQVKLNWTVGDANNANVVIYEKGPKDSEYHCISRQPYNKYFTLYTPSQANRGSRVDYYAYRENSLGASQPLEAFIYPPFRNANEKSYTYVRKLSVTRNMDGWAQGSPEFYADVFGIRKEDGSVEKIHRRWFNFTGGYKQKSQSFTNKSVYEWLRIENLRNWYDAILIWLHEDDGGKKHDVQGSFTLKADIAELMEVNATTSFTISIDDGDDDCGDVILYYFDQPESTLYFSGNYGAKMIISETGE